MVERISKVFYLSIPNNMVVFQVGRVIHSDMKGGLSEGGANPATLTAFVLISLLEAGVPPTVSVQL